MRTEQGLQVIGQEIEGADRVQLCAREGELTCLRLGDRGLHVGEEQGDRSIGDSRQRRPEHTDELHQ